MLTGRIQKGMARLDTLEGRLCLPCNLITRNRPVRAYFKVCSRLGDGVAWYALFAVLPLLYGTPALLPVLIMAITGLLGVFIYKWLKLTLVRERPFASHLGVQPVTAPLDQYSFPSGHTMHATSFAVQLAWYFPEVLWLVTPFALSVAVSRVILGLHYPTDVVAGALMGWALARSSLYLVLFLGI